ncbi:hypothetical protein ACFL52_03960, partial [Candidatus Margulisiibacteriota bacterium]
MATIIYHGAAPLKKSFLNRCRLCIWKKRTAEKLPCNFASVRSNGLYIKGEKVPYSRSAAKHLRAIGAKDILFDEETDALQTLEILTKADSLTSSAIINLGIQVSSLYTFTGGISYVKNAPLDLALEFIKRPNIELRIIHTALQRVDDPERLIKFFKKSVNNQLKTTTIERLRKIEPDYLQYLDHVTIKSFFPYFNRYDFDNLINNYPDLRKSLVNARLNVFNGSDAKMKLFQELIQLGIA